MNFWRICLAGIVSLFGCYGQDGGGGGATPPRSLVTPIRAAADLIASAEDVGSGWRIAIVGDAATWRAFADQAAWGTRDFQVDFEREVVALAIHDSNGGALTFDGWSVVAGRGRFVFGPSRTFGPAWADAGKLLVAVAVPRAELASIDFVRDDVVRGRLTVPLSR